jgi:hypothetical protein
MIEGLQWQAANFLGQPKPIPRSTTYNWLQKYQIKPVGFFGHPERAIYESDDLLKALKEFRPQLPPDA